MSISMFRCYVLQTQYHLDSPAAMLCMPRRTKHRLHLVSRRFNEALKEPCEAWEHLTLHAKQISKVCFYSFPSVHSPGWMLLHCHRLLCHQTHIHLLKCRIGVCGAPSAAKIIGVIAVLVEKLVGAVELAAPSMLSDALAGPAVSAVVCELAAAKSHRSADAGRHLLLR